MASNSSQLLSCTHSTNPGNSSATLSLGTIAPTTHDGATPFPVEYRINLTRGQVDSIALGLQRVAQQLGADGNGE